MEIVPLSQVPAYCPVLARWAFDEWYRGRSIEYETVLMSYRARAAGEILPGTLVAVEEGLPAGMVTLKRDDLWSRKDLNPWLSALFVASPFRGRGIGQALVGGVSSRALELGYASLFLFIGRSEPGRLERYYRDRGWEECGKAPDNDGFETVIMRLDLPAGPIGNGYTGRAQII